MRISCRWLERLFSEGAFEDLPPRELARRLTMLGLAVDDLRTAFAGVEGVVLGQVVEAGPHPNADKLTLCTVLAGDGAERRVVCGAPNVEVGGIYGYATVGSRLPGGREIGRAKIRGVESEGMLCSAPELGLDALGSAEGIWRVPGAGKEDLGRDLGEALGLDDTVLDVEVPSNRGDLLSHLGAAREVQWIVGEPFLRQDAAVVESGEPAAERASVTVEDAEGCPLYLGRLIEGVTVGPSPGWLQTGLLALGMRPVNNVVDATNWVMLECGQPLHPFDFERLAGGRIVVRAAREGEEFVTLDGKTRELEPGTTMICDAERPVAIGGVMGGLESEVSDSTTSVFLEAAWFDPHGIARTSRALGLVSEASTRFARGVDPEIAEWAVDRAAGMIAGLAGGRVAPGRVADAPGRLPARPRVELRLPRLAALVGREVAGGPALMALESLGFDVEEEDGEVLAARVPSWRFDIEREVDLIEEIARLTGYETVPLAPLPVPPIAPAVDPREAGIARLAEGARAAGFDEARTPSFVGADVLPGHPVDRMVEIRNPISKDDRFLRPFVFTTLARAVAHNRKQGAGRVKLFEVGHAFGLGAGPEGVEERRRVAFAAIGRRYPLHWSQVEEVVYDFFDLKGDLADVVERAAGFSPGVRPGERPYLHPGRQAEVVDEDGRAIGFCGELHPRIAERWEIDGRLHVAELELDALIGVRPTVELAEFSREPAVERDLALVVPDGIPSAAVLDAVRAAGLADLVAVEVFDRYRGPQVPAERYSLGLRTTFRADRTLTDEEVDREIERLVARLESERGWILR